MRASNPPKLIPWVASSSRRYQFAPLGKLSELPDTAASEAAVKVPVTNGLSGSPLKAAAGLGDRSHRPHHQPQHSSAELEALEANNLVPRLQGLFHTGDGACCDPLTLNDALEPRAP